MTAALSSCPANGQNAAMIHRQEQFA